MTLSVFGKYVFRIYGLIGILFLRFAEFVISGYEYEQYRFERFFASEKTFALHAI